nr:hypothetical protein [Tanacetum cinerariifolium]
VILFSIHGDEWKSFQSQHQTALRGTNTLSWKPCQGGSSKIEPTWSQDQTMALQPHSSGVKIQDLMLDHQDKNMMKAQVHMSKSFAISVVQTLPRKKLYRQNVKADVEREIVSKLSRS